MSFDFASLLTGSVASLLLSAAVRTMPAPTRLGGNVWYTWIYDFAQAVLANFDKSGWTNKSNGKTA